MRIEITDAAMELGAEVRERLFSTISHTDCWKRFLFLGYEAMCLCFFNAETLSFGC